MNESFLHQLLELLASNKKLPYYQAERRIDIFINFFLEDIMNHCMDSESIRFVVPEFPLKKYDNARSTKVDYLCFDTKKNVLFFVELKTDVYSYQSDQLDMYLHNNDWSECLEGLLIIEGKNQKTKHRSKFEGLRSRLNEFKLSESSKQTPEIKVVYIVPSVSEDQKSRYQDVVFLSFSDLAQVRPARFHVEWDIIINKLLT